MIKLSTTSKKINKTNKTKIHNQTTNLRRLIRVPDYNFSKDENKLSLEIKTLKPVIKHFVPGFGSSVGRQTVETLSLIVAEPLSSRTAMSCFRVSIVNSSCR